MLRFTDDTSITSAGDDVLLTGDDGHLQYLPGAAADLHRLARVLRQPCNAQTLRQTLPLSVAGLLDALVDAGAVVNDPVPDRLLALHRATLDTGNSMVDGYGDEPYLAITRRISGPTVQLSFVRTEGEEAALASRRSCRNFDVGVGLGLDDLGYLLGATAGYLDDHRAYPSAGGLYPVEIVLGALRVTGLDAGGSLRYDPCRHVLTKGPVMPPATWLAALPGLGSADPAAVALITVDLARPSGSRYAERGYRFAVLEAGHLAQNLMFVATHHEIGSLAVGAIAEEVLYRGGVLGHPYEVAVYAVAIGRPAATV